MSVAGRIEYSPERETRWKAIVEAEDLPGLVSAVELLVASFEAETAPGSSGPEEEEEKERGRQAGIYDREGES